jgi:hypothetical protein
MTHERGLVVSDASVSLDGYVAYDDNSIGDLFEWYDNCEVEVIKVVAVAAGTMVGQALSAGLLDLVNMDVVPIVMGSGRPYFGGLPRETIRLGDLASSIRGRRVTHLSFPTVRD